MSFNIDVCKKPFLLLCAAYGFASVTAFAQTVVVTPGSAAAYVFCPKSGTANKCPPQSTVGRWMFKLRSDSEADSGTTTNAFVTSGLGSSALKWTNVQNRVYVGYGEFKINPTDPTKGTFSGIVDLPPSASATGCPSYSDYCTMTTACDPKTLSSLGQTCGMDTPLRYCHTTTKWAGSLSNEICDWSPNTGVIECKNMASSFTSSFGTGVGNCVAHYVQRRTSAYSVCPNGYSSSNYLYQARVYNLQIKSAYDFTDGSCAAISN